MKNIVLYGLVVLVGLLIVCPRIAGQKPAYALLPSTHRYIHPEAILDTSIMYCDEDSIIPDNYPLSSSSETIVKKEAQQEEKKIPGLHFDSLFQKSVSENERSGKRSGNYPLIVKYVNPIHLFLQITALKK
jgi:hypothetical protein